MEKQQKRQVARICSIIDILTGDYIREEGWTPNYILTKSIGNISRANLLGVIVEIPSLKTENESYSEAIIEDGSGRISLRDFEGINKFNDLNVGEVVLVIGRPRQYGSEKYILTEIVRKIQEKKWIEVRKLELQIQNSKLSETTPQTNMPPTQQNNEEKEEILDMSKITPPPLLKNKNIEEESTSLAITNLIREKDEGDGVDTEEIINQLQRKADQDEIDNKIDSLLKQGVLFEVKPGRIKFLE
jgi:RPA family protein